MRKDLNKGILSIEYNVLNLPEKIVFADGKEIKYVYSASGEKLQNIVNGKTLTYCGGFVYENGILQYILNSEGRYVVSGSSGAYEYNLTDHLGNVRAVVDGAGAIKQKSNYYPFGMTFDTYEESTNKYLYNGKELQEETGWLDYGARMYASELGRWMCVDPLAEKYSSLSAYNYCLNNPIIFVDPDGQKVRFAPGVSKQFKADFTKAIKYLNKNGAGSLFASLEKSNNIYLIAESKNNSSSFSSRSRTIKWNSRMGMITDKGVTCSPATILNHEADHANQFDKNPDKYKKDSKRKSDSQYDKKEERRVIEGSEQDTAKKNGEIKEGQVTRNNHKGTPLETNGPTSTIGKYEIAITPKNKEDDKK